MQSHTSDVARLAALDHARLVLMREHAQQRFQAVETRFAALDNKAINGMQLVAVVSGIVLLALPAGTAPSPVEKVTIAGGLVSFLASAVCSLLCLRIRKAIEPPTTEVLTKAVLDSSLARDGNELLAVIVVDLANAESSHLRICDSKAFFARLSQYFQLLGVGMLVAAIVQTVANS